MTSRNPFDDDLDDEPDTCEVLMRQMIDLLLAIRKDQAKMHETLARWSDVFAKFNEIGERELASKAANGLSASGCGSAEAGAER